MSLQEFVTLKRDCEAVEIPSGRKMTLPAGTEVVITQSLGGTYTVYTKEGVMASIVGKDADALGKEPPPPPGAEIPPEERSVEKLVWNQLRTCYDPEIPHNIVDLGLIYGCHVTPLPEGGHKVSITMTLTAPGCGMGDWLRQDVQNKLLSIPDVKEASVEMVFDPPWDPGKMNPAIRREFM